MAHDVSKCALVPAPIMTHRLKAFSSQMLERFVQLMRRPWRRHQFAPNPQLPVLDKDKSPAGHQARHYRAFIPYKYLDNTEENRQWADWLHQELEGYVFPTDLVRDRRVARPDFPESLYPVFRDELEIWPADYLGTVITQALRSSDSLVVICTTRSARSPWVNVGV